MLVDAGLLDESQLDMALTHQRTHGGRLGLVLVSLGFLSEEDLESKLSQQLGIMVREVDNINPSKAELAMVPEAMMRKHEAIPIRMDGNALVVGMVDPTNQLAIDEFIFVSGGRNVCVELITEATLRRFLDTHFTSDAFRGEELDEDFEIIFGDDADESSWEAVKLADFILDNAVRRRASDVHIEPYETFSRTSPSSGSTGTSCGSCRRSPASPRAWCWSRGRRAAARRRRCTRSSTRSTSPTSTS